MTAFLFFTASGVSAALSDGGSVYRKGKVIILILCEELANDAALVFIFDASKEFCSKRLDCLRTIERHAIVDLSAAEMAWLTSLLKDGFDLRCEVNFRRTCV